MSLICSEVESHCYRRGILICFLFTCNVTKRPKVAVYSRNM